MPKGPKGQKRPADAIGNAVRVMEIATGRREEQYDRPDEGKNKAAAELGRRGGKARAEGRLGDWHPKQDSTILTL